MPHQSRRVLAMATLLLTLAWPAAAQQPLRLDIRAGRVTLHAQNVPLRQVLTEWARIGGTTIVNIERVAMTPVTIDLTAVPERQALDTLLRNVAGYVLGARPASTPGVSAFDRILILASSVAPRPPAGPVPFANGPATRVPQPQFDPNDPEENPPGDIAPGQNGRPIVRPPNFPPNAPRPIIPGVTVGPGVSVQPFDQSQPDPPDPPDTTPAGAAGPGNPFGVPAGSSARPGVIAPAPQQPRTRPRTIQDPD